MRNRLTAAVNKEAWHTLRLMQAVDAPTISQDALERVLKNHSRGPKFARLVVEQALGIQMLQYRRHCARLDLAGHGTLASAGMAQAYLLRRLERIWPYKRPAQGLFMDIHLRLPGTANCPHMPQILTLRQPGKQYSRRCAFRRTFYNFTILARPAFKFFVEDGELVVYDHVHRKKWRAEHLRGFDYIFSEVPWQACNS